MEQQPYDVPGPVTVALEDQGRIQPGTDGWWQVWGARVTDIRAGDLVMAGSRDEDGTTHVREYAVTELAPWNDRRDMIRVRFLASTGEYLSLGLLQPVQVLRRGTKHTLSDSI